MKLSIGFSEFSYTSYGGTNSDVFVNGGMTASCYPDLVTYGTTDVMVDHNSTRDANGSRMPLSGTMTMAVPGFHSVPATFTAPTTAEVTITSSQGDKTYIGWRDITTTSSCSTLQEIIDRATNGL